MLASGANLKVLYCSASELAALLLAAHRLHQLSPRLSFGASVEGAVVGRTDFRGEVALRRVVRVVHVQLDTEGEGLPCTRGRGWTDHAHRCCCTAHAPLQHAASTCVLFACSIYPKPYHHAKQS